MPFNEGAGEREMISMDDCQLTTSISSVREEIRVSIKIAKHWASEG